MTDTPTTTRRWRIADHTEAYEAAADTASQAFYAVFGVTPDTVADATELGYTIPAEVVGRRITADQVVLHFRPESPTAGRWTLTIEPEEGAWEAGYDDAVACLDYPEGRRDDRDYAAGWLAGERGFPRQRPDHLDGVTVVQPEPAAEEAEAEDREFRRLDLGDLADREEPWQTDRLTSLGEPAARNAWTH